MVNTLSPYGFREWRRLDGSPPTGGFETLLIASSDVNPVFTGDPVATSATGPYVTVPATGNSQVRGIFKGCEYYSPAFARKTWQPYFPGSVMTSSGTADVQAWVVTDPEMLWTVQTSTGQGGTGGAQITSTGVGMNFGFSSGTSSMGNTMTGVSNVTLNSSSIAVTATLPFRLADLLSNWAPPGSNGTDNTTLGNIVIVAPNNWDRKNTTGI